MYRLTGIFLAVMAPHLVAAHGDEEFTEHAAHEHGKTGLMVTVDRNILSIGLDSAAQNLLGFEHAPRTAAETSRVTQVAALLAAPGQLFKPNAEAQCQLTDRNVGSPMWQATATHSDYEATFKFTCGQPAQLKSLTIDMSALLLADTQVTVASTTDKGQTVQLLPALKTVLPLP